MKGHYEAHFQFNKPHPDKRILNLTPLYAAPPAAPMPEPVAWGMFRADGLILDVITPEEHESYAGEYTVPLYAAPPAAPADSQPRTTKPVVSQKAANLTDNAGMVMVPREPTIAMCLAGDGARHNVDDATRSPAVYRAMIAAAPAPVVRLTDERAAFEAWIRKDCGDLTTFGSGSNMHYRNSAVNNAWTGWHARAVLSAAPVVREPQPTPRTAGCLMCGHCAATGERVVRPAVPLTDEQLARIAVEDEFLLYCDQDSFNEIARAIEKAHGIGGGGK